MRLPSGSERRLVGEEGVCLPSGEPVRLEDRLAAVGALRARVHAGDLELARVGRPRLEAHPRLVLVADRRLAKGGDGRRLEVRLAIDGVKVVRLQAQGGQSKKRAATERSNRKRPTQRGGEISADAR